VGWEHETQLSYTASKGGGRFKKMDMDSCISEVEGSPHPSDTPTDNQYAVDGIAWSAQIQAVMLRFCHTNQSISLFKFTAGE
jgi:hypothetical protein